MDIGVPSGRVIGGRCVEVFTSWLSVRRTHTCVFQFSITDTAHYQFLQAMSSFVLFFVYVIILYRFLWHISVEKLLKIRTYLRFCRILQQVSEALFSV